MVTMSVDVEGPIIKDEKILTFFFRTICTYSLMEKDLGHSRVQFSVNQFLNQHIQL